MNVGVIGYGYWGPNLVRNFVEASGTTVVGISDLRPERLARVNSRYPTVKVTTDYRDVIHDPAIDIIVIATPVSTHYNLALEALQAGKHVLVEKPMTATSEQGERLIEEAARRGRVLMVDHTFVYTGAVRRIGEIISGGELGEVYYYDSTRVNLGLFQHDVNVVWDLAVHDLSIIEYSFTQKPCAVSATGVSHIPGQPENVAYITLYFTDSLIAHINVNWLAPVKIRRTLIGGSRKMIVYDELEPSEKIKIYDRGVTVNHKTDEDVYKLLINYRSGDMWSPQIDLTEALQAEVSHFIDCIENGQHPITGGEAGLRVVGILEAISQSMAQRGTLIEI